MELLLGRKGLPNLYAFYEGEEGGKVEPRTPVL